MYHGGLGFHPYVQWRLVLTGLGFFLGGALLGLCILCLPAMFATRLFFKDNDCRGCDLVMAGGLGVFWYVCMTIVFRGAYSDAFPVALAAMTLGGGILAAFVQRVVGEQNALRVQEDVANYEREASEHEAKQQRIAIYGSYPNRCASWWADRAADAQRDGVSLGVACERFVRRAG